MKRNRWKNRLSLLLVALMLFTALAPVALAVGEPEAITEVTEPAESDKVSEDPSEPPAPAQEDELGVGDELMSDPVAEGTGTKIIFVNRNKQEKPVTFANDTDKLDNQNAVTSPNWNGLFIGWATVENYDGTREGTMFYPEATIADLKAKNLIPSEGTLKLYEVKVGYPSKELLESKTGIRINDERVSAQEFVEPGDPERTQNYQPNVDRTVAKYESSVENYKIKKLDAKFTMNPFVAAAVYRDPWMGALDNQSDENGVMTNEKGDFTIIDLHVKVDERIKLPKTFKLKFHSYVFRPVQMFSGNYEMIGVGSGGTVQQNAILDSIVEGDPDTTFTVQSFVENAGEETPIHDFILRTRVRTQTGQAVKGKKITDATMDQITSDMYLTFEGSNDAEYFTVSNAVAKDIADGKKPDIEISGFIKGQVRAVLPIINQRYGKTVQYGTESEVESLSFVKEEPTPPVEPPVVHHKTVSVEKIWEDGNDEAKKRPDSITVKLLANGEDTGRRLVLSAKDNWKGSFYGLDYTQDGKTIEYTVTEIGVKDYESKVSGSDKSGYIITNTVVPEKPAPAPTPEIKLPKIPHITKPLVVPTIPKAGVGR